MQRGPPGGRISTRIHGRLTGLVAPNPPSGRGGSCPPVLDTPGRPVTIAAFLIPSRGPLDDAPSKVRRRVAQRTHSASARPPPNMSRLMQFLPRTDPAESKLTVT